jgi:protein-disulfide isomerase
MSEQEKSPETAEKVVFKTPPKIAFTLGILAGLTVTSLVGFALMYSVAKSNGSIGTAKANTNTGTVAGAATNTADVNSAQPTSNPPHYDIAITADDHIQGDKNAKVTLVLYSDFQCPYCSKINPTIEQVMKDYGNKVRLVFRHFPLTSIHENAQKAAEASECASDQGKFWEMHDKMFANQTALTVDNLKQYAKDLKLNTSKFNDCLDSGKYTKKVTDSETQGINYGVQGTPAAFANGTLISSWSGSEWQSGAQPYSVFKQFIDAALAS